MTLEERFEMPMAAEFQEEEEIPSVSVSLKRLWLH